MLINSLIRLWIPLPVGRPQCVVHAPLGPVRTYGGSYPSLDPDFLSSHGRLLRRWLIRVVTSPQ